MRYGQECHVQARTDKKMRRKKKVGCMAAAGVVPRLLVQYNSTVYPGQHKSRFYWVGCVATAGVVPHLIVQHKPTVSPDRREL